MASDETRRLWKVAQIDTRLAKISSRKAALENLKLDAELRRLEAEEAGLSAEAHRLHAEQRDIELRQKTIQDKIAKIEREGYGSLAMGPRAAEILSKEVESLKRQRDHDDERLLELFEIVEPAQKAAAAARTVVEKARTELAARQEQVAKEIQSLKVEQSRLAEARPAAANIVAPAQLARYDAIRQRAGGVGMVEVVGTNCGGCGTNLPERTLQALREDKQATCEACHRLLYFSEGVI